MTRPPEGQLAPVPKEIGGRHDSDHCDWFVMSTMPGAELRRRVGVLGGLGLLPAERLSGLGRRVMANLAVKGPTVLRTLVCADLWPDMPEERSRANLRRVLWQLPAGWVVSDGPDLVLLADVDLTEALEVADRSLGGAHLTADELRHLARDLLPGWYEEWVIAEQELFRLRRVQALEEVCRTATELGDCSVATQAGLSAVTAEPLRESAVTALVAAHLREGNRFEARRRYRAYATLLDRELGAPPGIELQRLVSDLQE